MTRNFDSLGELALHLLEREVATVAVLHHGLERCLDKIEKTAMSEFGTYQPDVPPFEAWPELADFTKADRLASGFTENDPLLRSGELRVSSGHEVHGLEGVAGSTDPIMLYQELGTPTIPPRPVWGPALIRNKGKVERIMGLALVEGIVGGNVLSLAEYDFKGVE